MRLGKFQFSPSHFLRRFAAAQDGAVAIFLAVALLPLIVMGGASVDLRRLSSSKTQLQTAADAAALAGANALRQDGDAARATQTARNYVMAALQGAGVSQTGDPTVTVTVIGDSVNVKVNASVAMTLMKIARINDVPIKAEATAAFGAVDGNGEIDRAEIVLAFDTTGSMGLEGRLDAAKTAAKTLINKVMFKPDGSQDPNVRIGLVPFAKYVNVGLQYRNESWMFNAQDWTVPAGPSCGTAYRTWDLQNMTIAKTCWSPDETYRDCSYTAQIRVNLSGPYQVCSDAPAQTYQWNGCVGSDPTIIPVFSVNGPVRRVAMDERVELFGGGVASSRVKGMSNVECAKPLVRLTSNQGELNSSIDALTPNGFTYIAPAVLWSWRLLTRGQPFDDARPDGNAVKSIVLMTDGANTRAPTPGYYDHDIGEFVRTAEGVTLANNKTLAVCANAKAAGIKIYTIGFMAPEEVKPILRACASTATNYYDAPTIPELQRAYSDIGVRMIALRLIK